MAAIEQSPPPTWAVALFAHNEARTIVRCLESISSQGLGGRGHIFVLANGCRDRTTEVVEAYATQAGGISCVVLSLADKANAWNRYIHEFAPPAEIHFFIDGDVAAAPGAFTALSRVISSAPSTRAAGAVPAGGRNAERWLQRMVRHGHLAGGLYALSARWLQELRGRSIRLPVGLIGDDLFVSCLAKQVTDQQGYYAPGSGVRIVPSARFQFDSLSPMRAADWLVYARRRIRYRVRDRQLALLLDYLSHGPARDLPADVASLYRACGRLPGFHWQGVETPFDWAAVRQIRREAK